MASNLVTNIVTKANSPLLAFVERFPDSTRHALTEDGDWQKNIQPALNELAQIIALERNAETRLQATRLFMECVYCHARTTRPTHWRGHFGFGFVGHYSHRYG